MSAPAGDFDEFVRAYTPTLLRTAYLLTGDQHHAEDLVQSALARAHRSWHRIDDSPFGYVRRTMYHLQVATWRRRRIREWLGTTTTEPLPEPDVATAADIRITLQKALAQLTDKQRAVIVLRFYEDRSVEDTATVLRCSTGTVKSQTAKALAKLRQLMPSMAGLLEGRL